jgi:hypothetical protein
MRKLVNTASLKDQGEGEWAEENSHHDNPVQLKRTGKLSARRTRLAELTQRKRTTKTMYAFVTSFLRTGQSTISGFNLKIGLYLQTRHLEEKGIILSFVELWPNRRHNQEGAPVWQSPAPSE